MNTVTVSKQDLIKVLTENRDKHQTEYNEAYEGYKLLAIKAIEEKLEKVKSGEKFNMYFENLQSAPNCHVEEYQNVIDMLSVTSDMDIQISQEDYLKYYKNNWSWRIGWSMSNAMYMDAFHGVAE
jgi:hypothetical protein